MFLEIVTTITSRIDLSKQPFDVSHVVEVDAEAAEGFPEDAVMSVVLGGCEATQKSIRTRYPRVAAADERTSQPVTDDED